MIMCNQRLDADGLKPRPLVRRAVPRDCARRMPAGKPAPIAVLAGQRRDSVPSKKDIAILSHRMSIHCRYILEVMFFLRGGAICKLKFKNGSIDLHCELPNHSE